jgi:nucleotide-binding universal stress UspA family protein
LSVDRGKEEDMFKTIVLALDGSEGSRRAIPVAEDLAKRDEAHVVAVHVGARASPEAEAARADVEKLSAQGIDTEVKVTSTGRGGPAVQIADIANQEDADVIVTGTRGHGGVTGLLVGSVTQRLLHVAHRPVLAVPPVAGPPLEERGADPGRLS